MKFLKSLAALIVIAKKPSVAASLYRVGKVMRQHEKSATEASERRETERLDRIRHPEKYSIQAGIYEGN